MNCRKNCACCLSSLITSGYGEALFCASSGRRWTGKRPVFGWKANELIGSLSRSLSIYGDMGKFLEMPPKSSEYLFARGSKPIKDFRETWKQACQGAGVPNLLFHDLRRTAVRNLRRARVAETVIMKITGHQTRSVFERYNITDHSDTQEAGRMAEEFLAKEHEDLAQITSHEKAGVN